jgi:hypothetical protein
MYYNTKNQQIYHSLPNNAYNSNKALVQNLPLASIQTIADCGYYTIRSDSPTQPDNTIEDISSRVVNIDTPYIDIIRTWINQE